MLPVFVFRRGKNGDILNQFISFCFEYSKTGRQQKETSDKGPSFFHKFRLKSILGFIGSLSFLMYLWGILCMPQMYFRNRSNFLVVSLPFGAPDIWPTLIRFYWTAKTRLKPLFAIHVYSHRIIEVEYMIVLLCVTISSEYVSKSFLNTIESWNKPELYNYLFPTHPTTEL